MSDATPPLRADAARNRQRLLDAAGRLFAERGLDVSMEAIAKQAGVGLATAYRRFPDRDALVDALFEDAVSRVAEVAADALTVEDPWDGLVRFLRATAEVQAIDRGARAVVISTSLGQDRVATARARIAPLVDQLVARAHASGDLRADVAPSDLPPISVMLAAAMDFADPVRPDLWERQLTLLLDGLRARRTAPTAMPGHPLSDLELETAMGRYR